MNVYGEGILILKGYGKILKMNIDNDKPLLIEDASLIAMEERIDFNTVDVKISDELKEFLKSGVEAPYSIKGNGVIWLQTKGKYAIQEWFNFHYKYTGKVIFIEDYEPDLGAGVREFESLHPDHFGWLMF